MQRHLPDRTIYMMKRELDDETQSLQHVLRMPQGAPLATSHA